MLTAPRVTVVVATYNRSNVLQWTLRSLQRLTGSTSSGVEPVPRRVTRRK